jgi:hypothetical protein
MDRDDAGTSDRGEEARQGDTGMIGSESEDPGPGRDTSLTDPDPAAASTDQPRGTVAMSEGDPMRTRLGSHIEGAGAIGYDVAASEEGATEETPAEDRPGYESERPAGESAAAWAGPTATDPGVAEPVVDQAAYDRDPGMPGEPAVGHGSYDPDLAAAPVGTQETSAVDAGLAAEPVADQDAYARDAGLTGTPAGDQASYERDAGVGYEGEPGGAGMAGYQGEPESDAPATYTDEEADVTGRPEYADRAEGGGDQHLYQQEAQRADRPGGGGSLFTDEEPERLDRPGPQEPGVQEGVYNQEADQARQQRPSDGV